jgi:hypothetical protein
MNQWFHETSLPRYLISAPIAEKVVAGNREMTRIQFKVANYGSAEGVIKPLILTEEPIEKLLYLEPGQTKEVHYLSLAEPSGIRFNTLTSGNLPNQIEYSFEQINETAIINAEERRPSSIIHFCPITAGKSLSITKARVLTILISRKSAA